MYVYLLLFLSSLTCITYIHIAVAVAFMDEKIFANESSPCVDVCVELTGNIERDVEVAVASGKFYNLAVA